MLIPCIKCQGDGDDPWEAAPCEGCDGSGNQHCENRSCTEVAVGFDEDGKALCEDCLFEWMCKLQDEIS